MDKNKIRSGRTNTPIGNLTPAPGVYGHSHIPTVSEYEQADSVAGKFKTAETEMGGPMRQVNQMRRAVTAPSKSPAKVTSSNAKKTKNKYRSGVTNSNVMKGKI